MNFVKFTIGAILRDNSLLNSLDLEILIAYVIGKSREFVLAHPEYKLSLRQLLCIKYYIWQRTNNKPIAYITGHKEFYGLDFEVNKHTLIPRPETEQIVESVFSVIPEASISPRAKRLDVNTAVRDPELSQAPGSQTNYYIIDIGTGSGNIIISIAKKLTDLRHCEEEGRRRGNLARDCFATARKDSSNNLNYEFYGIDISRKALKIAKKNARKHGISKKIKLLHGNLLEPILNKFVIPEASISQRAERVDRNTAVRDPESSQAPGSRLPAGEAGISDFSSTHSSQEKSTFRDDMHLIITANLPYLSKDIYNSSPKDVTKFEPKSALYSTNGGLAHYEELFKQITAKLTDSRHCEEYRSLQKAIRRGNLRKIDEIASSQAPRKDAKITIFLEISPEQKEKIDILAKKYLPEANIEFEKDLADKWRICEIVLSNNKS